MSGRNKARQIGPKSKIVFSFMDKETYDSLLLTRWLDKSGKPIEDHPKLPKKPPEKTILKRTRGMPMKIMLKADEDNAQVENCEGDTQGERL